MNEIVELASDASLTLLDRVYGEIYVPEFPNEDERESLANLRNYLRLKKAGWYGLNNYHILAMLDGDRPIAISISDYLADPNAGVIEFLAVGRAAGGNGFGTRLLQATQAVLEADSIVAGSVLSCIVAEMNDPFAPHSLDDNLDPFDRARIWGNWGYGRLDIRYVQPTLSPVQNPVRNLLLIGRSFEGRATSLPSSRVASILQSYMRWAMRIDDPVSSLEYREMESCLRGREEVALQPLEQFIGHDPARPLYVRELSGSADPDWKTTLALYSETFPSGDANIDIAGFSRLASVGKDRDFSYHLWSVRGEDGGPVKGLVSFFTFTQAGFGGYICLSGAAQGTRRFPLLLARCEEQIRRDAPDASGWYIECDPAKVPFFARFGFCAVDIDYRQPPLRPGSSSVPQLTLMYKALGRDCGRPEVGRETFFVTLAGIFRAVYEVEASDSPQYRKMREQAELWPGNVVQWR